MMRDALGVVPRLAGVHTSKVPSWVLRYDATSVAMIDVTLQVVWRWWWWRSVRDSAETVLSRRSIACLNSKCSRAGCSSVGALCRREQEKKKGKGARSSVG